MIRKLSYYCHLCKEDVINLRRALSQRVVTPVTISFCHSRVSESADGIEALEIKVLKALAPALDSGGTAAYAVVGMSEANA